MRITKPVEVHDVSQVLAPGNCPICALLKNDQATLLRVHVSVNEILEFCNFHGWALAAASERETAAKVFLNVLNRRRSGSTDEVPPCTFCSRLLEREVTHIRELLGELEKSTVREWMQQHGTLCLVHAAHLRELANPNLHPVIDKIVNRNREDLRINLEDLLRHADDEKGAGGGILGRAAEFLISQRGIHL